MLKKITRSYFATANAKAWHHGILLISSSAAVFSAFVPQAPLQKRQVPGRKLFYGRAQHSSSKIQFLNFCNFMEHFDKFSLLITSQSIKKGLEKELYRVVLKKGPQVTKHTTLKW